ncbi:MAG: carbonic anhydrase [Chitinophagaceae bacterium]
MNTLEKLFEKNRNWVKRSEEKDDGFFKKLAAGQSPKYLWIGCGDSRMPAEEILGLSAGEIFVHRNVANQVLSTDINARSVIEYALIHLKVKHVIVCGHYGCGGVKAALSNNDLGETLNMWLKSIKEVYVENEEELSALPDAKQKEERLVELNILKQVDRIIHTSSLQKAWKENPEPPIIHGWVFSLETGYVKPLLEIRPDEEKIDPIFRFENIWK